MSAPSDPVDPVASGVEGPIGPMESLLAALVASLAGMAWVGLITAHAGRFMPGLSWASGLAVLVASGLLFAGHLGRVGPRRPPPDVRDQRSDLAIELATIALAIGLVARLLPLGAPWPAYLDASFYLNTAARIAEEGSLRFAAPALDAPPTQARQFVATFSDQRALGLPFPDDASRGLYDVLYAADLDTAQRPGPSVVAPYHPPIFSTYLALWASRLGLERAPLGLIPWALTYLLATGCIALRAYGRGAAALAVALVGLGPSFAYHGGSPYAEVMAGALLLGGLWTLLLLDRAAEPAPKLAAFAGLLLGISALTKIDVWPAVALAVSASFVLRRQRADAGEYLCWALGLGAPLLHLGLLALGPSRLYLELNLGGVGALVLARWPELALLAFALALVALGWRARGAPLRELPARALGRPARVTLGLALVVLLTAITLRDGFRAEDALPSMFAITSWAITPLGLWAAAAGLVLALESGAARARPLLWLGLTALPLVMVAPVVTRSLSALYSLRRLVPLALPLLAVFAAGAALQLARMPAGSRRRHDEGRPDRRVDGSSRSRRVAEPVSAVMANWPRALAALLALLVLLGGHQAAAPFVGAAGRDFAGGPALIERIASYGAGPDDVFVFASAIGGNQAGRLAAPMRSLTGATAVQIGPREPDAAALGAWADASATAGRRVVVVADAEQDPPEFAGYDLALLGEEALVTRAPSPNPQLPPVFSPLSFNLRVFALEPAVEAVDGGR